MQRPTIIRTPSTPDLPAARGPDGGDLPRSPALVVSLIALFLSIGGTGYAALKITGKNVKNSSLTGADIKNNSVTGKDVKSLSARDFSGGQLPAGVKGDKGETGPPGPQGMSVPPPEAVRAVAPPSSPTNCDGPVKPIGEFCGLGAGATPWSNYGSGFQPAGFYKDGSGLVHLQGGVTAGGPAVSSVHRDIFYLPSGYRPTASKRSFLVDYDEEKPIYVEVRPDGMVFSSDVPPRSFISFDGALLPALGAAFLKWVVVWLPWRGSGLGSLSR